MVKKEKKTIKKKPKLTKVRVTFKEFCICWHRKEVERLNIIKRDEEEVICCDKCYKIFKRNDKNVHPKQLKAFQIKAMRNQVYK